MANTSEQEKWLRLSDEILATAHFLLAEAVIPATQRGPRDVKVLAVTLLVRTISNFRGAIELARQGAVVEARILVRCCYENLLWIDGLVVKGDAFAEEMLIDEHRAVAGRGQYLLDRKLVDDPAVEDRLRAQLRDIRQRQSRRAFLNPKAVAAGGRIDQAYLIYGQLSADAAHPSLTALSRYVVRSEENGEIVWGIDAEPAPRDGELDTVTGWACGAMLGACIGANEILQVAQADWTLRKLLDEIDGLGGQI